MNFAIFFIVFLNFFWESGATPVFPEQLAAMTYQGNQEASD